MIFGLMFLYRTFIAPILLGFILGAVVGLILGFFGWHRKGAYIVPVVLAGFWLISRLGEIEGMKGKLVGRFRIAMLIAAALLGIPMGLAILFFGNLTD